MFAYLEKSQHVNGMTGETTDVAVETGHGECCLGAAKAEGLSRT